MARPWMGSEAYTWACAMLDVGEMGLGTVLGVVTMAVWTWLLAARGRFWQSGPEPGDSGYLDPPEGRTAPSVTVVIPARNEAEHIAETVGSLLGQEYTGALRIVVVDDNSTDGTGERARAMGATDARLTVVPGEPLPAGWSGKMWAVSQGLGRPEAREADFVLLTDADILHAPDHVAALCRQAQWCGAGRYELVSEMVQLRTESLAERALIPAFVFFFQMLYPFRWVCDPNRSEAAAAGGTMLIARAALDRIGGVERIRSALIDDVALAREVKRGGHAVWLGHATQAVSLRQYPRFRDVFEMIARTAYVQLDYSPWMLAGTVAGMALVFVAPVALAAGSRGTGRRLGVASWVSMAAMFQPTLRRYRRSPLWGLALPGMAVFYLGATVGSAVRHYRRRGGEWKGRVYPTVGSQRGLESRAAGGEEGGVRG